MLAKIQAFYLLAILLEPISAGTVPQKRANVCGTKGYDRGDGNYFYDDSGKYNTYAACSALCVADTKCKSFGFGDPECMLFNIALSGNFDADSGSSDIYYDRGCISTGSGASASASSSVASSKTTSSTSKKTTTIAASTSSIKNSATSAPSSSKPSSSTTAKVNPVTTTSTKTSSVTSTSKAASVTVPADCSVPTSVSMTTFHWFNSTHNLDCVNANFPSDAQVCWNATSVCADNDPNCTCTPYCYTGLPAAAYQPLGFGPPDTILIGLDGSATGCSAANPQSIRRNELGEGHFDCDTGADVIGFTGDSNKDTGNIGSVYYNAYGLTCNGKVARYTGTFPLTCSHDAGNNATCTAPVPLPLTLSSWL